MVARAAREGRRAPREGGSVVILPEAIATAKRVRVRARPAAEGQFAHQLGVATSEHDVFGLERRLEPHDDVLDVPPPLLLARPLEAGLADVLLVGTALLVRQV